MPAGPKTPERKANPSQNALKHGLTSSRMFVLANENEVKWNSILRLRTDYLQPRNHMAAIFKPRARRGDRNDAQTARNRPAGAERRDRANRAKAPVKTSSGLRQKGLPLNNLIVKLKKCKTKSESVAVRTYRPSAREAIRRIREASEMRHKVVSPADHAGPAPNVGFDIY